MNAPHDFSSTARQRIASAAHRAFPSLIVRSASATRGDLVELVETHLEELRATLRTAGAVLFRGFGLRDPEVFREAAELLGGPLDGGYEGPSPRHALSRGIFTASDVSPLVVVPEHSEMSYLRTLPRHLFLWCVEPSPVGGETTVVDARRVLERLSPEAIEPLLRGPLRIRRRHARPSGFHDPFELVRWNAAFGTEDRDVLLERTRALEFRAELRADGSLVLEHDQPAVRPHPETGEEAWLNHLLVFHSSTPAAVLSSAATRERDPRAILLSPLGHAYRPLSRLLGREVATDVHLADGTPIPDATVRHVREVVDELAYPHAWEAGDFLVVDNHLALHGRRPYRGRRDVRVAWSKARA